MDNKQRFTLVIGEPGVGKSYQIISRAIDDKKIGRRVYIMCPTHASKKSLRSTIAKRANESKTSAQYDLIMSLQADVHVGESAYYNQDAIYVDELGQTSATTFYALLLHLQGTLNAKVYLFGDIQQLQPVQHFSPLEALLRNNAMTEDLAIKDTIIQDGFWTFVHDSCYGDFNYTMLNAPESWRIDSDIRCELLSKNYRLGKLGYESYNNDFFDDIVSKAIQEDAEVYAKLLKKQLAKHSAILVATKKRGAQADNLIKSILQSDAEELFTEQLTDMTKDEFITQYVDKRFKEVATFIKVNNRVYLNPDNEDYEVLQQKFDGVPVVEDVMQYANFDRADFEYHVWATVHSMQGITVSSVTFFMGNEAINPKNTHHYSRNLLYTSITRASDEIVLLGLVESFEQMAIQQPLSPQDMFSKRRAIQAKDLLFTQLKHSDIAYNWNEIYDNYLAIFENHVLDNAKYVNLEDYAMFDVKDIPYDEHELHMQFRYYNKSDTQFFDYKKMFYEEYKSELVSEKHKGNQNAKGKGKIKKWLDDLSDDELVEMKRDIANLSVRKFKARWGHEKKNIRKYFEN